MGGVEHHDGIGRREPAQVGDAFVEGVPVFAEVVRKLKGGAGFGHERWVGGGFFAANAQDLPVGMVLEPADHQVGDI